MKEIYEPIEIDVIRFVEEDVITTSGDPVLPKIPDDGE